jgi:hypothetical protein
METNALMGIVITIPMLPARNLASSREKLLAM